MGLTYPPAPRAQTYSEESLHCGVALCDGKHPAKVFSN